MSGAKTTLRTEQCSFTELKIYPGHGKKFAARDGKVATFYSSKAASLFRQHIKAVNLKWAPSWRRANKKMTTEVRQKKRNRKAVKTQRAIVGLSLDEIRRKRAQKPELRKEAKDAALKEAKERQQKKQQSKPMRVQPQQKGPAVAQKAQSAKQPKTGRKK